MWKNFSVVCLIRLENMFVFFGFSLMSVTLAGNKYVNFIMIALVEVPAYVVMWASMDLGSCGRKTILAASCFLAALPCLVYLFVPSGDYKQFFMLFGMVSYWGRIHETLNQFSRGKRGSLVLRFEMSVTYLAKMRLQNFLVQKLYFHVHWYWISI